MRLPRLLGGPGLRDRVAATSSAAEPNLLGMTTCSPDEREEIVAGWLHARHAMTQAEYCAAVAERAGRAVSPRTLRAWVRGSAGDVRRDSACQMLRAAVASLKNTEVLMAQVRDALALHDLADAKSARTPNVSVDRSATGTAHPAVATSAAASSSMDATLDERHDGAAGDARLPMLPAWLQEICMAGK